MAREGVLGAGMALSHGEWECGVQVPRLARYGLRD